jgi:hypothetical protein
VVHQDTKNVYPLEPLFDSHRFEDRAEARDFQRSPEQRFDRLAFALKALDLLRFPQTRVAVFRSRRLTVESGRQLGGFPESRWAMVGIPSDASAQSIVLALTEIAQSSTESRGLPAALAAADLVQRTS